MKSDLEQVVAYFNLERPEHEAIYRLLNALPGGRRSAYARACILLITAKAATSEPWCVALAARADVDYVTLHSALQLTYSCQRQCGKGGPDGDNTYQD